MYGYLAMLLGGIAMLALSFGSGWHYGAKGPKAQLATEHAQQEARYADLRAKGVTASAQASVDLGFAFARIDSLESDLRKRVANAPTLRGISLPSATRSLFNESVSAERKPAAEAAAGVDAKAGAANEAPVELTVLLDTCIVNAQNHLRAVEQVLAWQKFYTAVYQSFGESK